MGNVIAIFNYVLHYLNVQTSILFQYYYEKKFTQFLTKLTKFVLKVHPITKTFLLIIFTKKY